jgi:chromosome segregation ATPase
VQDYVTEFYDMRRRLVALQAERAQLDQAREQARADLENARIRAARVGSQEPSGAPLEAAKDALSTQDQRIADLMAAFNMAEREFREFLELGAPAEIIEALENEAREHEARHQDLMAQAAQQKRAKNERHGLLLWARGADNYHFTPNRRSYGGEEL